MPGKLWLWRAEKESRPLTAKGICEIWVLRRTCVRRRCWMKREKQTPSLCRLEEKKKKRKKRGLKRELIVFDPEEWLAIVMVCGFFNKSDSHNHTVIRQQRKDKFTSKAIIDATGGKDLRSTLSISSPSLGMMRRTKNARLKWRWTRSLMAYEGILNGIPICDLTERLFPRKLGSLRM